MAQLSNLHALEPGFRDTLLTKWNSPAVGGVLRARGSLADAVTMIQKAGDSLTARQQADAEAHGFRACALASCARREATVKHFKLCSGCEAVAYCCDEHAVEDWRAGHRKACKALKAAGARPQASAERGGV
jgi:hypothetical protein